jgi:hypothetical protein
MRSGAASEEELFPTDRVETEIQGFAVLFLPERKTSVLP